MMSTAAVVLTIVAAILSGLASAIGFLNNFILSDMVRRIERLEERAMKRREEYAD